MRYSTRYSTKYYLPKINGELINSFLKDFNKILNRYDNQFIFDTSMICLNIPLSRKGELAYILFDKSEPLEDQIIYAKIFPENHINYGNRIMNLIESNKNVRFLACQKKEIERYRNYLGHLADTVSSFSSKNNLTENKEFKNIMNNLRNLAERVNKLSENQDKIFIHPPKKTKRVKQLKKRISCASNNLEEKIHEKISEIDQKLVYSLFLNTLSEEGVEVALFSRDKHIPDLCYEVMNLFRDERKKTSGLLFGSFTHNKEINHALDYHSIRLTFYPD